MSDIKYLETHEWYLLKEEVITVGISDFAQNELGDIVFVEIETEGETLDMEEIFGSVEAVKTVSDLFMPLSGEIITFNENLDGNPELVNSDPYNDGWMIKIKISNIEEINNLMDSDAYNLLIK